MKQLLFRHKREPPSYNGGNRGRVGVFLVVAGDDITARVFFREFFPIVYGDFVFQVKIELYDIPQKAVEEITHFLSFRLFRKLTVGSVGTDFIKRSVRVFVIIYFVKRAVINPVADYVNCAARVVV